MSQKLAFADDHFHDECGVFGVFGHPEASNLAYLGLYALQHRGQESAGIVSSDGKELHVHRAMGEVEEIFQPSVLAQLPGSLAIGHTRYSTAGDKALLNAQPIMIDCNKGKVALGHNGNLTNAAEWRRRLEHRGSIFQTNSDTEVIVHLIARSQTRNLSGAIGDALNQVEGAYSLLLLTQDELYAVRDPRGFRPLALGKLTTPGVPAAVGYALESKIPFRMGLIRNHYIGRTFIEPSQAIRNFGVKLKLNPIRGLIEGQRVILVDDSIVRGTTSRKIVRMVREVGAKEVHVRISCPPTISPCYYGVDTPTREESIASSNSPEEICKFLGADSLGYVSLAALRRAVGDTEGRFCTSCYTGVYPTDLVQLEVRESAPNSKSGEHAPGNGSESASAERPVVVERES